MNYKFKILSTLLFFIIFIPFFVYLISKYQDLDKPKIFSPIIEIVVNKTPKENKISKIRNEVFHKYEGVYSIYIKNLKSNEEYFYNEEEVFNSASLYKLWVMAVVYKNMDEDKIKITENLASTENTLNKVLGSSVEPGDNENKVEDKIYQISVSDALTKMITVSDNYSALLLASRSGSRNISLFIKDNEFKNSNFKNPPETSAKDIGNFYNKLYKGEFIGSDAMLELLKNQAFDDRIPKYLPADIEIANKTGELDGVKHDSGIVFSESGDYIIVVLTDSKDSASSAEKIALFSKRIYDYFSERN